MGLESVEAGRRGGGHKLGQAYAHSLAEERPDDLPQSLVFDPLRARADLRVDAAHTTCSAGEVACRPS
jgi:hypothetical protein